MMISIIKRAAVLAVVLATVLQAAHATPLSGGAKFCNSIDLIYREAKPNLTMEMVQKALRRKVGGCQIVAGNLAIKGFGADPISGKEVGGNFRQLDTDFLDSIEEIYGQLIIEYVNIERLTFRNLRVIRGCNYKSATHSHVYALDVFRAQFPMKLQLPKLTSITSCSASNNNTGGHARVRISGQTHPQVHCYLAKHIDWSLLFDVPWQRQQELFKDDVIKVNSSALKACSTSAGIPDCDFSCQVKHSRKRAFCWSSGVGGCQQLSQDCRNNLILKLVGCKGQCYRDASGSERCCHSECLGGCSGGGPHQCNSCECISRSGVCQRDCRSIGGEVPYEMEFQCVAKCPPGYLKSRHGKSPKQCVTKCSSGEVPVYTMTAGGSCKECSENCVECNIGNVRRLTETQAVSINSQRCNVWHFKFSSLEIGPPLRNSSNVDKLHHLRVFYGTLLVKRLQQISANLRFLRNLEYVSGKLMIILTTNLRYLGLAKLQFAGELTLFRTTGLCKAWLPVKHLAELAKKFPVNQVDVQFDEISEECRTASCDRKCGSDGECWGPGPEMCVQQQL